MMTFMNFNDLSSLVNLKTLNALRILIDLRAEKLAPTVPMEASTMLMLTMKVSKMFMISVKKPKPYAMIFRQRSITKTMVKKRLIFVKVTVFVSTIPVNASITVFPMTKRSMELSYSGFSMIKTVF